MVLETSVNGATGKPGQSVTRLTMAIDDSVGGELSTTVDKFIEKIVLWATERFGSDQVVSAKEEFYWKTGKVFPDDIFFNSRMAYFLDYFVFQRPLEIATEPYRGLTPYEAFTTNRVESQNPLIVSGFRHSLFEVQKIGSDKIAVLDVLDGEKKQIWRQEFENFGGIAKKDIFQGYIYLVDSRYLLSRGLVFHPKRAHRLIRKFIKKNLKSENFQSMAVLSRFAKIELRHKRHTHVDPKHIYSEDPR